MKTSSLGLRLGPWALAALLSVAGPCLAHGEAASGRSAAPNLTALLQLDREPQPLAARYRLTVTENGAQGQPKATTQTWYFYRSAQQVAVVKSATEEIWQRDSGSRISFERVLHADRHVVGYTAGELLTLGVQPGWNDLAGFIDTGDLLALRVMGNKPAARGADAASAKVLLAGRLGGESLQVEWLPALQLPALVERRSVQGGKTRVTRLELLQQAAAAAADWPAPGARSANYQRLDAADFGDMAADPVVRKAEAMDIRAGWRVSHGHD